MMTSEAATGNHHNWDAFKVAVGHQMKTANEHPPRPWYQISERQLIKAYDDHELAMIRAYWHQAVLEPLTWDDLAKKVASSVRYYRGMDYDSGITGDEWKRQQYIFFAHVARMFWHQHNREPTGFESRLMVARWSLLEKSHSIEDIKAQDQWQHPSKYPKPIDTAMVIDALKSINADSVAFEAFARLVCTKLTSRDQQRLKGLTNILEKKYLSEYKAAHEYKRQGIVTDTVSEIRDLLRKMGAPPAAPATKRGVIG